MSRRATVIGDRIKIILQTSVPRVVIQGLLTGTDGQRLRAIMISLNFRIAFDPMPFGPCLGAMADVEIHAGDRIS